MHTQGYAASTVTKPPDWHALVAWDLLFNNLTTGLFLVAAVSELLAPAVFASIARFSYSIALVFLVIDLACLVLDLGDPLRFHHMLRVFKPSSPMSLGTWCLAIYSLPLTAVVVLSLIPERGMALEWIRRLALILAFVPAFVCAFYKGVLLSTNAQPGWRDARWLGGYLANSAFPLGCAQMLVLSVALGPQEAINTFRVALVVLLVLNLVPLALLAFDLRSILARTWRAAALGLVVGTLIPLALLFVGGSVLTLAAVFLVLLGKLVIRFLIIKIPHVALVTRP